MFREGVSILILGGGLQALSVSYSLHRLGYRTYVYSHERVFRHCKFVTSTIEIGSLSVQSIINYIKDFNIGVIIPMGDNNADWLSSNKDLLQSSTNVICAVEDPTKLERASSKSDLLDLCQRNGISVPKTCKLKNDCLDESAQYIGFPALIKPDHSVGARGIARVENVESLKKLLPSVEARYGKCSLQEFIDNPDYYFNVMLYRYDDGSFAPCAMTKITRFYPVSGGSSSLCVTVNEKELSDLCMKTLNVLDWRGFADFDVLYDRKDNKYKIIEINPRVPASIRVADAAGINFPQIIVADALKLEKPVMQYKTGVYLRYLGLDIMWFIKSPKRFSTYPSWFKFFGKNLYYQDLYRGNWRFAIDNVFEGVKKIFRSR